uniref:Uncharacterized protein n=1 Tax=Pristionchus pacificus TaxID=54126 RepID=A0A8R1YCG8_PRIPA
MFFELRSHVYFHNYFHAVCFDVEEVVQTSEKVHFMSEVDRLNSILTIIGYILDPSTIAHLSNADCSDVVESVMTSTLSHHPSTSVDADSTSLEKALEMQQLNRFIAVIKRLQSSR